MAENPAKRTRPGGLGRGLSALIGGAAGPGGVSGAPPAPGGDTGEVRRLPLDRLRAADWQPRHAFPAESLEELVASIREHGILQPLLVRARGNIFEVIAGERRLRAAAAAGLAEVPVRVLEVDDREALELALIENLQREDLDPIEEAEGYRALGERFGLTQEQIAARVGRARASVANALRLLGLPDPVRESLAAGRLSVGHAKVLLGLAIPEEQRRLAARAEKEGWSVRELERRVARLARPPRVARMARDDVPASHVRYLADRLREKLGTGVTVHSPRTLANGRKAKGAIHIDFYSSEDLDRLIELLGLRDDL